MAQVYRPLDYEALGRCTEFWCYGREGADGPNVICGGILIRNIPKAFFDSRRGAHLWKFGALDRPLPFGVYISEAQMGSYTLQRLEDQFSIKREVTVEAKTFHEQVLVRLETPGMLDLENEGFIANIEAKLRAAVPFLVD